MLKIPEPLSFLGGVDASTGELKAAPGGNVAGRVLVFPRGKGSTVGSFVMYDLKVHGKAPAAVVNESAETIVATGAVISSTPMVDSVDVGLLEDGDSVVVDGDAGAVEVPGVRVVESASSAIVSGGRVLMLRRPASCRSYPGVWSLCAGKLEPGESPLQAARREIAEETSLEVGEPAASLGPVEVREGSTVWRVHPFLFLAEGAEPVLNEENEAFEFVRPGDLEGMELVPRTAEVVAEMLGAVRRGQVGPEAARPSGGTHAEFIFGKFVFEG